MTAGVGSDQTDEQLVERARRGDPRAFDLLVLKYQPKVLSLIARYLGGVEDAQDVAQEAFIKAFRALGNFRGDSAFYTWLYRIAINAAKNHLAARSRRPPAGDVDLDDAAVRDDADALREFASPEEDLSGEQLRETVERAIEALSPELREALVLREFEGLSYEEIAEVMSCPVGTVRSRIFRARDAVDEQVQAHLTGA